MAKLYAVKKGFTPGIYHSWDECKKQVDGFSGAQYKSFKIYDEAISYLGELNEQSNKEQLSLFESNIVTEQIDGLVAYVDGSFNEQTNEYGYGCVFLYEDKVVQTLLGKNNKEAGVAMRNVSGEMLGTLVAIQYAIQEKYKGITIYYDYEGIEKWPTGKWKTSREGTKSYARKVNELSSFITIRFVKVKAHSGDVYNDMADALAKKSIGIQR